MKLTWKFMLLILAAALLLSSCAFSRDALIGSWKQTPSGDTWIFTQEGVLRIVPAPVAAGSAPTITNQISYRFLDDTNITITPAAFLQLSENEPIPFTIQGDTLTLQLNGQQTAFTRVP